MSYILFKNPFVLAKSVFSQKVAAVALCIVFAGSFSSCSEKGEEIPFSTMAKGSNLDTKAGFNKQNVVIRTQDEWNDLLAILGNHFIETEVDFDTYQVIAVIDEVRSGQWEFAITRISNYPEMVVVTVNVSAPNRITHRGIIQLYHVVKIPKLAKKIEFKYIK